MAKGLFVKKQRTTVVSPKTDETSSRDQRPQTNTQTYKQANKQTPTNNQRGPQKGGQTRNRPKTTADETETVVKKQTPKKSKIKVKSTSRVIKGGSRKVKIKGNQVLTADQQEANLRTDIKKHLNKNQK